MTIESGICARCSAANPTTRSHCLQCGARLPWIPPASPSAATVSHEKSSVKLWPFWAGDDQKKSTLAAGFDNFYPTQWCLGADKKTGIAIDETAQKLCLLSIEEDQLTRQLFGYRDILGSEIVEDGYIVATSSGGAGSSLGGLGALPRGLTQQVRTGASVSTVAFKLVLNALDQNHTQYSDTESSATQHRTTAPDTLVHIVKFLCKESARGGGAHKAAVDKAQHWHRLIVALLHIEDLKQRPLPVSTDR